MAIVAFVVCMVGIAALFGFARLVDPRTGRLDIRRNRHWVNRSAATLDTSHIRVDSRT